MNTENMVKKVMTQSFKSDNVNGVDVFVWLIRHVGFLFVITPIVVYFSVVVWRLYMKPEVKAAAAALDKPIIVRVDTLENRLKKQKILAKETHYIVKKMELIQSRTAPKKVVREAAEEIEIEKVRDLNNY